MSEDISYSPDIITIAPDKAATLWNDAREAVAQIGPEAFQTEEGVIKTARFAVQIATTLPNQVLDIGAEFQDSGIANGAVVFRGLTLPDQLTRVVPDEYLPNDPWSQTAGLLAVTFTTAFGPPIQFSTNPRGPAQKFVTSVSPRLGHEETVSVSRTTDTGWHTEVGSSPWRPATVHLLGIRSDGRAINRIIPPDRIINALDTNTVETLMQPRFLIPDGLVPGSDKDPRPVITQNFRGQALTFSYNTGSPVEVALFDRSDRYAKTALREIRSLLDERGISIATRHILLGGDVFVMDNNGIHSRGSFTPNQVNRRWALRTFGGEQTHLSNGPIVNPNLPYHTRKTQT